MQGSHALDWQLGHATVSRAFVDSSMIDPFVKGMDAAHHISMVRDIHSLTATLSVLR